MSRAQRYSYNSYDDDNFYYEETTDNFYLYKYVKYEDIKKIINNFNLKLSTPTDTNDPFEFLLKGETTQSSILSKYRILCLSRTGKSPTMWAHYSADHKGGCLEFEFKGCSFSYCAKNRSIKFPGIRIEELYEKSKTKNDLYYAHAFNINYSNERVKIERFTRRNVINRALTLLTTKSSEWDYEKESRFIFLPQLGNEEAIGDFSDHLMPFLKRIILGVKTTNTQREEIEFLLEQYDRPKIPITKASIHRDKYEINID